MSSSIPGQDFVFLKSTKSRTSDQNAAPQIFDPSVFDGAFDAAQRAMRAEIEKRPAEALECYKEALDGFLHLSKEHGSMLDERSAFLLRTHISEFLTRAELLQMILNLRLPGNKPPLSARDAVDSKRENPVPNSTPSSQKDDCTGGSESTGKVDISDVKMKRKSLLAKTWSGTVGAVSSVASYASSWVPYFTGPDPSKPTGPNPDQAPSNPSLISEPSEKKHLDDPSVIADSNRLAPNFVEYFDEDSGLPYFYNTVTQESVWERPAVGGEQSQSGLQHQHLDELRIRLGNLAVSQGNASN